MTDQRQHEPGRGRQAARPSAIPRRGWRDILKRTWQQIEQDNVDMLAAGLAFYGMLAIFPALAAFVSIYGLIADPAEVREQFETLTAVMPGDAAEILGEQLTRVSSAENQTLSLAAIGSLLVALWSASRGTKAFMIAMNIAYNEREKRNLITLNLMAIGLTLFLMVIAAVALAVTVAVPAALSILGLESALELAISVLRWPAIALFLIVALGVLYRFAPCRSNAQWRWLTPGSVAAIVLWLIASIGFSIYVRNFGNYNQIYGSIGAIVVAMFWFWLSAFVVIMGAELNAETEHQTARDSTEGKPQPMGQRGAFVADTLGEKR